MKRKNLEKRKGFGALAEEPFPDCMPQADCQKIGRA
jgi:hypothetical protein